MNKKTLFAILLAASIAGVSLGQTAAKPKSKAAPAGQAFATPDEAVDALLGAIANDDTAALASIFGPLGKKIVSSGDNVSDKNDRTKFVELARGQKRIVPVKGDPNRVTLAVGPDDWPFPIPLAKTGGKWRFDMRPPRGFISAAIPFMEPLRKGADLLFGNVEQSELEIGCDKTWSDPGTGNGITSEISERSRSPRANR